MEVDWSGTRSSGNKSQRQGSAWYCTGAAHEQAVQWHTFSSIELSMQKRNTCTSFFCPMRCARSMACPAATRLLQQDLTSRI